MLGRRRIFLTFMVAAATYVSLAFNIDMTKPVVYVGEQKDFFGYKVLQYSSGTNKGIIATAPLRQNGSGAICKSHQNQTFRCTNPQDISLTNTSVKHLGLSLAKDSKRSQFTVCSPSVVHECYENSYMNSVCFNIADNLQQTSSFTSAFQDCTKKTVDLVFLFDGSGSMTEGEFNKNKDFIVDIINSLKNSSIKFAAVQFSFTNRNVFDFNDYQAGSYLEKLMKEPHMRKLTNTHNALTYVLDDILKNPKAGASPDATKVVVLITDGDPSDRDRGIIKRYDDQNIIRFVIGVKDAKLEKFRAIASEPKDKNAFKIENYDGLKGVLESFQKKIFQMEGSKVSRAGELNNEMSQSGFSAAFFNDTLILGSVGSNSWRGSLQDRRGEIETQIEDPHMLDDSYLGYSISVGKKNNAPIYFAGAPRFNHTGQVVLFRHEGKNWTAFQRVNGEQIGSYFGAELCSVDTDSDGNTDFLLVGAPQFYQPQEKKEGQIYIYTLTDEMQLKGELTVTAPSMGRFGTTISSLADLNGDGLRDVAVGAPLEDNNSGVVYIYLGDRIRGIRSDYSQRIIGHKIDLRLRFFGQSIDGDIDLGEDELPDIVVGSQGIAVVLRSRPVFNVMASLYFQPKEINTDKIECLGNTDANVPMVNLTACFEMVETTSKAEEMSSTLNISYSIDVDPTRTMYRGFFSETNRKARNLTSTPELRKKDTCFNHYIYMQPTHALTSRLPFMNVLTESTRPTLHSCNDLEGVLNKTICGVSRPVFRSRSSATFRASFRIINEYEWNDTIVMTITGKSENTNSNHTNTLTKDIPVQFEIKMAVTVKEDLISYLNFTTEDTGPKQIVTTYKIGNLGFKDFPVNLSLFFPTKLGHNFEMTNYQVIVQQNKTQCSRKTDKESEYCSPEEQCKVILCDSFILEKESPTEITLIGDVQFRDLKQHAANIAFLKRYTGDSAEVKFKSFIEVDYDNHRYVLSSYKKVEKSDNDPTRKWMEVRVEFIIPPDELLIILTGCGVGLLLLIIITVIMFKLGCFKRKTLEYYQEQEEEALQAAPLAPTNETVSQSETDDKSDQLAEENMLLDDGEASGSSPPTDTMEVLE
ncbi:integrin alpha-M [Notothenia coriiceps]|uniref:Integrin alpha-M n=1 Tax=Notothenia coriiceps TaxID=8208 RepID=A0A6I9P1Q8_9TELE|nr:PREDICTED: integrin alpha-M-like [Notothenia coriiceps]